MAAGTGSSVAAGSAMVSPARSANLAEVGENLIRACRRVTGRGRGDPQVIADASTLRRHHRYPDRALLADRTDGGKLITVASPPRRRALSRWNAPTASR